jgi:hypothetical protein
MSEFSRSRFINFGCWNENATTENAPLKAVIADSMTHNPDFYIINGDNYYQKKNKKTKTKMVIEDELREGMNALRNTGKEIFLLMGNHDLEMTGEEKQCETMIVEKQYISDNFKLPVDLVMFKEIGHNIIIMIDTNMYVEEELFCYNEILTTKLDDLNKFQERQKEIIEQQLSGKMFDNIIICGHHPIAGFKNQALKTDDKGKQKVKGGVEHIGSEGYDLLFDTIRPHCDNPNGFYYFCADIHNYQKGEVRIEKGSDTMIINEYIVGTGGTELDDDYNGKYNPNFKTEGPSVSDVDTAVVNVDAYNIGYHLLEHWSKFGYVVVDIVDNTVNVMPVNLVTSGGKKRKSRRKKIKQTKRRSRKYRRKNRSRTR